MDTQTSPVTKVAVYFKLLFLFKILFTRRVVNRVFPEGKLLAHLDKVAFKFLGSTHGRRAISVQTLLWKNLSTLLNSKPFIFKADDANLSYLKFYKKPESCSKAKYIFLAGDSHTEFYIRHSNRVRGVEDVIPYCLWLGPKTMMGIYFGGDAKKLSAFSLELINSVVPRAHSESSMLYAISLGSIDIRCYFYQALVLGVCQSEDELFQQFEKAAEYVCYEFKKNLLDSGVKIKVGLFEVVYCNELQGEVPKDKKEIRKILKKNPFPILGSLEQRSKWCDRVNTILRQVCINNDITFIEINRYLSSPASSKVLGTMDSIDNFHITNVDVVDSIFQELVGIVNKE